jgi:hypothetical protein
VADANSLPSKYRKKAHEIDCNSVHPDAVFGLSRLGSYPSETVGMHSAASRCQGWFSMLMLCTLEFNAFAASGLKECVHESCLHVLGCALYSVSLDSSVLFLGGLRTGWRLEDT